MNRIEIVESRRIDDKTGRDVVRFVPTLRTDCLAHGELTFAVFSVWADECQSVHDNARANAMDSARSALEIITSEVVAA